MATGYFPAPMVLNLLHVTNCVTQATLVTQLSHVNAQVTSDICGVLRGSLLILPPKVAGLVLLVGTRGLTMTGDCSKAGIRLDLDHFVQLLHIESLTKECIDSWLTFKPVKLPTYLVTTVKLQINYCLLTWLVFTLQWFMYLLNNFPLDN